MNQKHKAGIYEKYVKRLLDICCALVGLVALSPVLLITALLVRIRLGSPVIFCQERPGKDERIFKLYKFRSMSDTRDAEGNLLPDEQRLTSFGKTLLSLSIDELPELWCILKGDLSLVGPRALKVEYLTLYNERQHRRHEVRRGLTGYAQVHGRNAISWEERFELDVYYVEHISFLLDMKIVFQTFFAVLKREGISSETSVTMEPFHGTKE